jgi:hypothetical protein
MCVFPGAVQFFCGGAGGVRPAGEGLFPAGDCQQTEYVHFYRGPAAEKRKTENRSCHRTQHDSFLTGKRQEIDSFLSLFYAKI